MNIFRLIVALVFLAYGLAIGFLNDEPAITLDLLFFSWATTPGNAIILSLLTGVVVGALIVLATLVWPLYSKLRKANKQSGAQAPGTAP
jgi:lipopolysaccharide assembly protein A